jgi:hypothetical protein
MTGADPIGARRIEVLHTDDNMLVWATKALVNELRYELN